MKVINRNSLTWGAAAIASGSWAYSLAVRYTDFLFAPKAEKIAIFSFLIIISCLLSAWLFLVVVDPILKRSSGRKIFLSAGLSILVISVLFFFAYELPPFPEKHVLTITPSVERNPLSDGSIVELSSLRNVTLPSQKSKRIPVSQLVLKGSWQGSGNEFGIRTSEGPEASVSFERFMQAGMTIEFLTGPRSGMVHIQWDGEEQVMDLYSPSSATTTIHLDPRLDWRSADMTRKVLVAGALITDLFGACGHHVFNYFIDHTITFQSKIACEKTWSVNFVPGCGCYAAVCGIEDKQDHCF